MDNDKDIIGQSLKGASVRLVVPITTVSEESGSVSVCAQLVIGNLGRSVSVSLTTSNGNAMSELNDAY